MKVGILDRLEVFDPGFVRTRRGGQAVGAMVVTWISMVAVTSVAGVAQPSQITLFGAGACFQGALLVTDRERTHRIRTLGWAAVVSAFAIVVTVYLTRSAVWAAAALLVLLMFLSYALRSWSPRLASLVLMAAITTYVTGAGYITIGRIGWFVLASSAGFVWLVLWESLILPDDPVRSLNRSVQAFSRRAAETVVTVVDCLNAARDGSMTDEVRKNLQHSMSRVKSCRRAIDGQFPDAVAHGCSQDDIDQLRVGLYAAQRGLEEVIDRAQDQRWMQGLPDEITWSMTNTLRALAGALGDEADDESRNDLARKAEVLRGLLHDALTLLAKTDEAQLPPDALLAALTIVSAGEVTAQSITLARTLVTAMPEAAGADEIAKAAPTDAPAAPEGPLPRRKLQPTMALAIQAAVAAVVAGLIARAVGNEQSLVVAWTAFIVIGASAGVSTQRAWVRLGATLLGAVGGVVIAAAVPDGVAWIIAVVAVGVFFTVATASVSYPATVFWTSIALVPLFATEGLYLDLVRDKTVGALIGGGVAAVVALTVAPIRLSRDVRPTVMKYLDALDTTLASHLPGQRDQRATAETALDHAHSAVDAIVAAAAAEAQVFPNPGGPLSEQGNRVDAVHEAYLRLAPLLSDSSRRLHGWADEQVERGIRQLRDDVEDARTAARGEAAATLVEQQPPLVPATDNVSLETGESSWRIENLRTRLAELTLLLGSTGAMR